jgi:cytokinesis protein
MLSYPAPKKWTLIQSDALQEYQLERKRATIGPEGDRSAPEWYVRRIVDGSITIKELGSLSVSLRTQPIGWVRRFLEMQGMVALVKVLGSLSAKGIKNETDVTREYEIVKCLKTLLNNKVLPFSSLADSSSAPMLLWNILQPYSPSHLASSVLISLRAKLSPKSSLSYVTGTPPTATTPSSPAWTNSKLH